MLAKRIIPCLDIFNGKIIKGKRFSNHNDIGNIVDYSKYYASSGADELVFYDITASVEDRLIDKRWISKVAESINIPFCVAGGIRNVSQAKEVFSLGADKISVNTPALSDPFFISRLADIFGSQCVVVGIDSWFNKSINTYQVRSYTGNQYVSNYASWHTIAWVETIQKLGAGEVVINVINQDGIKKGYDIKHLTDIRNCCSMPLIASGGAGNRHHFISALKESKVDGVLAASVFHRNTIDISSLKKFLLSKGVEVRL
ncbi:imidazole glycerol phosphate synthase subunit HisF [Candidatus Tremblaya phenacola]|uniref:imidazole glycerol-phosphate synthase n=1 Tax=Candidatus Tremblayella phenacoccinincola TaxID=1010676 RepID=A0A2G0V6X8_9PROT|nr:imidazole glycerol phosphate synthase subunit HisF [Candidatus Tremblaya phenacola]PHN16228.1 Imidazole glycerol phosphate synthase subunit HisF [Candidatus Tremblaya phenacola]